MENKEFKQHALEHLKNNWGKAIAVCFIFWVITGAFTTYHDIFPGLHSLYKVGITALTTRRTVQFDDIINLTIRGPLELGFAIFFLNLNRSKKSEVSMVFSGFNFFGKAFITNLLIGLFTFLWSLLLIVPGIIAALSYSMTYFIMVDNPELSPTEAIDRSKEMMSGHKGELFYLVLSFIGWYLLGLLAFGVGVIVVDAYYGAAKADFYENIRDAIPEIDNPVQPTIEV